MLSECVSGIRIMHDYSCMYKYKQLKLERKYCFKYKVDRESENDFEEWMSVFHCNESLFLVMYNGGTYIRARNFNGLSQARFLLS